MSAYDFFGLQPLLIARIKATVAGTQPVVSGMSQDDMLALPSTAPAIYVLYDSYTVLEQLERELRIDQTWLVVTVLKSDRTDVKTTAGPLLGNLMDSLAGWQPSRAYGVLTLTSAPKMTFQPAVAEPSPATTDQRPGLWHIPLAFSSTIYFTGNIP